MRTINTSEATKLSEINKHNIWNLQENDVIRLWKDAESDSTLKEEGRRYIDIIRTAFEVEELKIDRPEIIAKYEKRGMTVERFGYGETTHKWAIKKRSILRVTDLTYDNITHISAIKLLEIIERNFGGGWDSLSQSIKDIIESGFNVSTTTLPANRLHNPGGMYEKKIADGFEVLEIKKGNWVEAIFVKVKPIALKHVAESLPTGSDNLTNEEDEDADLPIDNYSNHDEDDYDEEIDEEQYLTTIESDPDSLDLTVDDLTEIEDDDY